MKAIFSQLAILLLCANSACSDQSQSKREQNRESTRPDSTDPQERQVRSHSANNNPTAQSNISNSQGTLEILVQYAQGRLGDLRTLVANSGGTETRHHAAGSLLLVAIPAGSSAPQFCSRLRSAGSTGIVLNCEENRTVGTL